MKKSIICYFFTFLFYCSISKDPNAENFEFLLLHSVLSRGDLAGWGGVGGKRSLELRSSRKSQVSYEIPKLRNFNFCCTVCFLGGRVGDERILNLRSSRKPQVSMKSQSWEIWIFVVADKQPVINVYWDEWQANRWMNNKGLSRNKIYLTIDW